MREERMANGFVWVNDLHSEQDDLAPVRGIINGLGITAVLGTIVLVVWWLFG